MIATITPEFNSLIGVYPKSSNSVTKGLVSTVKRGSTRWYMQTTLWLYQNPEKYR